MSEAAAACPPCYRGSSNAQWAEYMMRRDNSAERAAAKETAEGAASSPCAMHETILSRVASLKVALAAMVSHGGSGAGGAGGDGAPLDADALIDKCVRHGASATDVNGVLRWQYEMLRHFACEMTMLASRLEWQVLQL